MTDCVTQLPPPCHAHLRKLLVINIYTLGVIPMEAIRALRHVFCAVRLAQTVQFSDRYNFGSNLVSDCG